MKQFIVFIMAFLYLGVSSGIAMEIHYCMGERAGVNFFGKHNNDDRCGKCGMKEKKGGCCSNEQQFFKVNDAHKLVSNDIQFDYGQFAIDLPAFIEYTIDHITKVTDLSNSDHAPPPKLSGTERCILFCTFRL